MAAYPVGTSTILPGDRSFIVVAAAGASSGAQRIDTQGGQFGNEVLTSLYGASDSAYIRNIANKLQCGYTCVVAEDVSALESVLVMGTRYDLYVKRSTGATTYDKLADAIVTTENKDLPEDGSNHRTVNVTFSGGSFTPAVAAGTVPTLA